MFHGFSFRKGKRVEKMRVETWILNLPVVGFWSMGF